MRAYGCMCVCRRVDVDDAISYMYIQTQTQHTTHARTHARTDTLTRTHTRRAKSTEAQRQTLNPEWVPNTLPFLNIVTVESNANFRVEVRDKEIAMQSRSTVMLTGSV